MDREKQYTYLLTLTPPEEVAEVVDRYRQTYAKYTKYVIPPHITIYAPFLLRDITEEKLGEKLAEVLREAEPFEVTLNDVSFFEGANNVAYFKPDEVSTTRIKNLFSLVYTYVSGSIEDKYGDYKVGERYNPHMTIAASIPAEIFPQIKAVLSRVRENLVFIADSIYLYKKESGAPEWIETKKIPLDNKS